MEKNAKRNSSIDLLKIISFYLVVCVHFCTHSGFKTEPQVGWTMLIMNVAYAFSNVCVALFIMMTGYLMTNKKLCGKYYKGLLRVSIVYVLCCIVCLIYKVIFYSYDVSFSSWASRILNFTASDYGWYFEMYLGLFLLIPFLNLSYHALDTRKKKLILLLSMVILTALPGVLNSFNLKVPGWWAQPSVSRETNKLIPEWWTGFYPITYYFFGSYMREYPARLKKRYIALIWLASGVLSGVYYFYRFRGGTFFYGAFATNSSLLNLVTAASFFRLVSSFDLRDIPSALRSVMAFAAKCTFGAFLLSAIVDIFVNKHFKALVPDLVEQYKWAPLVTLMTFTASMLLAAIVEGAYDLVAFGISKTAEKRERK